MVTAGSECVETASASRTLRQLLTERRQRARGYSLRALARDLGVSHTSLSLALRGKRSLSATTLLAMARALSGSKWEPHFRREALLALGRDAASRARRHARLTGARART